MNERERQNGADLALALGVLVVAFPVAIVVWLAAVWWMRRNYASRWWPAGAAVAMAGAMVIMGIPGQALVGVLAAGAGIEVSAWTMGGVFGAVVGVLGRVALATSVVAVPVGLAAAAVTGGPGRELPGLPSPALRRRDARRAKRELARVERTAEKTVAPRDQLPPLAVVAGKGDLPPGWVQGKYLTLPARAAGLPRLVVGRPGQGKSVYLCREVYLAGLEHRQAVIVDCKGEAGFAEEVEAAYRAGWELVPDSGTNFPRTPGEVPTVHRWPDEPLNAWTGGPDAVANRLLSVWQWDLAALWYREVIDMALTLVMKAPGPEVASSREVLQRLQPGALAALWEGNPEEEALVKSLGNKLDDVNIRLGNLLSKLGGLLDGARAIGEADLSVLSLPVMGQEHQAESILRVALADLAHYVVQRKAPGRRLLVVVDEFSAVPGGREHAVHLTERGRSAGAATVLAVQSARGLGDDDEADRLIGAVGMIAMFGTAEPERILKLAGTLQVTRLTTSLGNDGRETTGYAEAQEYRVDANDVRALEPGYCYVLASGRAQRVKVIRTPTGITGPQPIIAGTLHPAMDPGRAVDGREIPPPGLQRQGAPPAPRPPSAGLDPSGRSSVPLTLSPLPGEEHPPDDHHPQEGTDG